MNLEKVLVVTKRSNYERYCEQDRDPRILQLFSQNHFTIQDLRKSHQEHRETLDKLGTAFEQLGVRATFIRRSELRDTRGFELVITVGGDGTFLAVSHHVRDIPMLGINSSPSRSTGVFCAATAKTLKTTLDTLRKGKLKAETLNRIGLVLNGHPVVEPVLNEALICAQIPAATARYVLEVQRKKEHHKSSGVYVGPAAGSTAAIRAAGGQILPLTSTKVQFVVREPYSEPGTKLGLVKGLVPPKSGIRIHSKMRNGMIYIDGAHVRRRFDFGDELQVVPDGTPLVVYGIKRSRR